ncbi:MAG: hypothetical protein HW406_2677 [Candidatus Brocadiaceae bacterium]|nr:hypothetical protein [Candidatus Brocadiaceae bacterium]
MKRGDIVKFKKVVDPGDDRIRMRLLEDPDGGRVLVESLVGMTINPTSIYQVDDLVESENDKGMTE